MKKIVFFLMFSVFLCSCVASPNPFKRGEQGTVTSDSTAYYKAKCDSLTFMAATYEKYIVNYENQLQEMNDSIVKLNNRPLMTKQQFLDLYKYERLLKYYNLCKKKPVNWKYYKGWSTRVFEE